MVYTLFAFFELREERQTLSKCMIEFQLQISSMQTCTSFTRGHRIIPLPEEYTKKGKQKSSPDFISKRSDQFELSASLSRFRTSLDRRKMFQFTKKQSLKDENPIKKTEQSVNEQIQSKSGPKPWSKSVGRKRRSGFYGRVNLTNEIKQEDIVASTTDQPAVKQPVPAREVREGESCCQIY